jgi:hypothetical protein
MNRVKGDHLLKLHFKQTIVQKHGIHVKTTSRCSKCNVEVHLKRTKIEIITKKLSIVFITVM